MLAASALLAFWNVNPFALDAEGQPLASENQLELASVGAMLVNELISNSRGMVEKPMQITFLSGGPKVEAYKLPEPEKPSR